MLIAQKEELVMKNFSEMSTLSQEVAENIDEQLYDCKEDCKKGRLSGDMYECVIRTVLNTMDNWTPRLKYATRCEVLDWFQSEYGLCL